MPRSRTRAQPTPLLTLDAQEGPSCTQLGLARALALVEHPALPLGVLNVVHVRTDRNGKRWYDQWESVPQVDQFVVQLSVRRVAKVGCAYGHIMLLVVQGKRFYLYDPDGEPHRDLVRIACTLLDRTYAGPLANFTGVPLPRKQNRNMQHCVLWCAFAYSLLVSGTLAEVFTLPIKEQRRRLFAFEDTLIAARRPVRASRRGG